MFTEQKSLKKMPEKIALKKIQGGAAGSRGRLPTEHGRTTELFSVCTQRIWGTPPIPVRRLRLNVMEVGKEAYPYE